MSNIQNIINVTSDGWLIYNDVRIRCALGKNGVTDDKREGDSKTPLGHYPLRELYYRPDRLQAPSSPFAPQPITKSMGWCDDSAHPSYNLSVPLPFEASHETLWREDNRYNVIVPMGYNDAPPVAGKGSAIFFHIAADDYEGTEGCVAIAQDDMVALLGMIDAQTEMRITE